jgi:hypothetical protein
VRRLAHSLQPDGVVLQRAWDQMHIGWRACEQSPQPHLVYCCTAPETSCQDCTCMAKEQSLPCRAEAVLGQVHLWRHRIRGGVSLAGHSSSTHRLPPASPASTSRLPTSLPAPRPAPLRAHNPPRSLVAVATPAPATTLPHPPPAIYDSSQYSREPVIVANHPFGHPEHWAPQHHTRTAT